MGDTDNFESVYGQIGAEGFERLAAAFYHRVPRDDLLGQMYPKEDLQAAEQRLAAFLIQRFGGPDAYSQQRGHPRLRMRHARFNVDQIARDRWMKLMTEAVGECSFNAHIDSTLMKYFDDAATFMINR